MVVAIFRRIIAGDGHGVAAWFFGREMISRQRIALFVLVVVTLLIVIVCSGCANLPQSTIDNVSVSTRLTGQTVQRIFPDGTLASSNPGVAGSRVNQAEHGQWTAQGLPMGLMSINPTTGVLTIASPKDVVIRGLKLTPAPVAGEPFLVAQSIEANLSVPLDVAAGALVGHIKAIRGMNADEARRYVESLTVVSDSLKSVLLATIENMIVAVP